MIDLEHLKDNVDNLIKFCKAMADAENDFKKTIEALNIAMPALHERMERIEKWIENEKKATPNP